jgi:regulator of sigma E protease
VRITGMSPREELPEEVARRAYLRQPVWKRILVITAGPLMNVIIAFVILFCLFAFKGEQRVDTTIAGVQKGSPAAGVLHPGDRIVAVDGVRGEPIVLRRHIGSHRCAGTPTDGCRATTPARLTVVRGGQTLNLEVRPRYDASRDLRRMLLGFSFGSRYDRLPAGRAATRSVTGMWDVTTATVKAITRLFYDSQARKNVSGVVGSYETTRQSFAEDDIALALELLALISLSLAIVNLFPFLPLDGGHIFWALAEKLRGRPIPFRVMEQASYVGFVLVIMLFVVGLTNDIDRLRGEGFGIR